MTITFITGANKGLGHETGRRLAELGHTVLLGARDVTSDESVAAAAADIAEHEGLVDLLINNAGVAGRYDVDVADLTSADANGVFDLNVGGHHPDDPSCAESSLVAPLYTASKVAVTMLSTQYAKGLPGIRVNAVDPGYTATDFNGHSGPQTVTEGTDAVVALARAGKDGGTGRFLDRDGEIGW